jgi:RNA polymerase sigma-70 factor (ECF subfamily)
MIPMDDVSVIQRVLAGDREAYRLLVERYQQHVFGLLRNLSSDRHQCEDITQEVFLAAYLHLHSFDARRSSFSTWLCTIARNKCLNARQKHRPLVWAELPEKNGPRLPEAILGEEELFRQLDAGLASLSPEQKMVFVLAELQGLAHEEIARIEQVPLGTVKSRLSRAKEKLRSFLRPFMEQP